MAISLKKNKKRIHVYVYIHYVYIHNDWTMDWIVKF